jgi:hypothetical protein
MNDLHEFEDDLRRYRPAPAPPALWQRIVRGSPRPLRWIALGVAASLFAATLWAVLSNRRANLGDDPRAREAFDRLASAARDARSLRVRFTVAGARQAGSDRALRASGVLLIKGNRSCLKASVEREGQTRGVRLTSDGVDRGAPADPCDVFVHCGAFLGSVMVAGPPGESWPRGEATGFRFVAAEGGLVAIRYSLGRTGRSLDMTLWFDPGTLRLVRRTIEGPALAFTETYDEYTPGADIPDSEFSP